MGMYINKTRHQSLAVTIYNSTAGAVQSPGGGDLNDFMKVFLMENNG